MTIAEAAPGGVDYEGNLAMVQELLENRGGLQWVYNSLRAPTQQEVDERLAWFSGVFRVCLAPDATEMRMAIDGIEAEGLSPEEHNVRSVEAVMSETDYSRDIAEDVVVATGILRMLFRGQPADWREIDVTRARMHSIEPSAQPGDVRPAV